MPTYDTMNTMKTIDNDIQNGQLKKVYLLFGEERYLLLQYRDKIINATTGREDTMNFTRFEGSDVSATEIIDLAETLPFFADQRLILIENSGFFKDSQDNICEYMAQIPDSTILLFCEKDKIDKRNRLYKAIKANGNAVEFTRMDNATLQKWIVSKIHKEGKQITGETLELFLSGAGNDMGIIAMELEKLLTYVGNREVITSEDVDAVASPRIEDKVFEMIDAIALHNEAKAYSYYFDLLALKVAPIKTLALLARHYRLLLLTKSLGGASDNEAASVLGVQSFVVRKYRQQCRDYSSKDLENILKELADLDYSCKSGNLSDQLTVELFIQKYAKKQ